MLTESIKDLTILSALLKPTRLLISVRMANTKAALLFGKVTMRKTNPSQSSQMVQIATWNAKRIWSSSLWKVLQMEPRFLHLLRAITLNKNSGSMSRAQDQKSMWYTLFAEKCSMFLRGARRMELKCSSGHLMDKKISYGIYVTPKISPPLHQKTIDHVRTNILLLMHN